jgi:hypothetical protein
MPGLRWTARGAVTLPETLQVRIEPVFTHRVAAGAPVPGRSLTTDEVQANVRYFANPGPRGRPVHGLVLSGIPAELGPLAPVVREAKRGAVRRVVVHVDGARVVEVQSSALAPLVDVLVLVVRDPDDLAGIGTPTSGPGLDLVVPLEAEVFARIEPIAEAARRSLAPRVTFTWPFPAGEQVPPPADEAIAALRRAVAVLGPVPWTLKGLPPCLADDLLDPRQVFRSSNRWYVDAEHQLDRALLFFPDVVRYAKREVCRFCDFDPRCDGVAEAWLRRDLVPPLRPVRR